MRIYMYPSLDASLVKSLYFEYLYTVITRQTVNKILMTKG
jgi:hypothetical protein